MVLAERDIEADMKVTKEAITEKPRRLEQERARAHRWIADGDGEDGLAGAGLREVRRERGGDDLRGERGRRVVRAGSAARGGRAEDPRSRATGSGVRGEAAGEGAEQPSIEVAATSARRRRGASGASVRASVRAARSSGGQARSASRSTSA